MFQLIALIKMFMASKKLFSDTCQEEFSEYSFVIGHDYPSKQYNLLALISQTRLPYHWHVHQNAE